MSDIPITRVTLYKHGVGYFERRATVSDEQIELSFRVEEMNDILKSLTVIDWAGGEVRGVDYATPLNDEERLAGCSIRLGEGRSMRDLLVRLRGRRVRLVLDQGERPVGILLGLDELPERQQVSASLVSLLLDGGDQVRTFTLERVQGLEILDKRGADDLRFFLQTALAQEDYRQVTVRLSPGEHDLLASYIAPAPTWRVSYRLVVEESDVEPCALLQGWGVFDNRLDEDLENVSLTLVAGMPISFVYDLYHPFMPERPIVKEETRAAAAPVEFAEAEPVMKAAAVPTSRRVSRALPVGAGAERSARDAVGREALQEAAPATAEGEELGELFQYRISTPVTVQRGHSAMVPIIFSELSHRKELIYNGAKMPVHPVATLLLKNETGLTLERGPVTVILGGAYVGEAVLPFTPTGGDVAVPYAVELGVKVREESDAGKQIRGIEIREAYLQLEEWHIRWRDYLLRNSTEQAVTVLVEHPRTVHYDLFDTPRPKERTDEHVRFEVEVSAHAETKLRVQERRLLSRREELQRQSYEGLQQYLQQGLLDQDAYSKVTELMGLWERIADNEKRLKATDQERSKIYETQQQIQGNMAALGTTGREGSLRTRYVEQLAASEDQLRALDKQEADLKSKLEHLRAEVQKRLEALG